MPPRCMGPPAFLADPPPATPVAAMFFCDHAPVLLRFPPFPSYTTHWSHPYACHTSYDPPSTKLCHAHRACLTAVSFFSFRARPPQKEMRTQLSPAERRRTSDHRGPALQLKRSRFKGQTNQCSGRCAPRASNVGRARSSQRVYTSRFVRVKRFKNVVRGGDTQRGLRHHARHLLPPGHTAAVGWKSLPGQAARSEEPRRLARGVEDSLRALRAPGRSVWWRVCCQPPSSGCTGKKTAFFCCPSRLPQGVVELRSPLHN